MTQKQNEHELNERMAKAMRWVSKYDKRLWVLPDAGSVFLVFSRFATDRNAFHQHVIPYLKKRGLMNDFLDRLACLLYGHDVQGVGYDYATCLTFIEAPAATLTLAAAEVCEEDNEAQPVVGDKRDLLKAIRKQNERNEL